MAITELLLHSLANPDVRAAEDNSFLNRLLEEEWSKDKIDESSRARSGGRTPLHIASARDDNYRVNYIKIPLLCEEILYFSVTLSVCKIPHNPCVALISLECS